MAYERRVLYTGIYTTILTIIFTKWKLKVSSCTAYNIIRFALISFRIANSYTVLIANDNVFMYTDVGGEVYTIFSWVKNIFHISMSRRWIFVPQQFINSILILWKEGYESYYMWLLCCWHFDCSSLCVQFRSNFRPDWWVFFTIYAYLP